MKISYGKNVYGKEEIAAVNKTLRKSTQMGKSVNKFENKVAKYFSKKYALMVNSGSSALTLAMNVLNIKKGDEIITPCLNFGTAVSSIVMAQAIPVFVDIEIETLQIDVNKIEKKITKKTKALLIPNLIGNIPNWKKIHALSKKYKLKIIEDSADTLGATINNKPTGIYSDISITSFYGSHVISCAGNGGMFLTNNNEYFKRAKVLRSWGRMSTLLTDSENLKKRLDIKLKGIEFDKKFVFSEIGYNFEPSEIGASFGLIQLKKFSEFAKKRNLNFNIHKKFFSKYSNYFITPRVIDNVKTNFLAYPIIIKKNKKFNRKKIQTYLEKNNIQTRPIFTGNILRHPAFKNLISSKNKLKDFYNSDYIMKHGLLIGCHQGLNEKNLNYIHQKVLNIIK
tara:strand:+ start:3899 stop:5083 length:1185 start_codon:yes stop_codon:yes gene_type:complete